MVDPYPMVTEPMIQGAEEFLADTANELDLFVYLTKLPNFSHMNLEKAYYVFDIWKYDLAGEFLRIRQLH